MSKRELLDQVVINIARLLDVRGALLQLPSESDAEAMRRDWQQVGDDLRKAMDNASHELTAEQRARLNDEALATTS